MSGGSGLGAVVKRRRQALGLSQLALAALSGEDDEGRSLLSQAFVASVEVGRIQQPGEDKLRELARVFGISYNQLLLEAGRIDAEPQAGPSPEFAEYVAGLERRNPRLAKKLRKLREENTEAVYRVIEGLIDRAFVQGVDLAAETAAILATGERAGAAE